MGFEGKGRDEGVRWEWQSEEQSRIYSPPHPTPRSSFSSQPFFCRLHFSTFFLSGFMWKRKRRSLHSKKKIYIYRVRRKMWWRGECGEASQTMTMTTTTTTSRSTCLRFEPRFLGLVNATLPEKTSSNESK